MPVTLNFLPSLRQRAQHEMDKVGQAADDAGTQVSNIQLPSIDIGGTIDSARRIIGDARKTLSESGDQIAHGAQQVAQGAQQTAQRVGQVGQDLRGRVDNVKALELRRKRRDPWPGVALVMGVAGGVAAMFLFDPQDGKRRRALLRDKLGKWSRAASDTAHGRAKDLRNRSQGLIHETRKAIDSKMPRDEAGDQAGDELGESTAAGQSDWPAQEPVGAAVGGESRTPSYSDMSHEPGAPNGREG